MRMLDETIDSIELIDATGSINSIRLSINTKMVGRSTCNLCFLVDDQTTLGICLIHLIHLIHRISYVDRIDRINQTDRIDSINNFTRNSVPNLDLMICRV